MKSTTIHATVAAQPGWFLAVFDDSKGVRYEPIIAWEIQRTTSRRGLVSRLPIPITAETNTDLVCLDWAIKRPDGKFVLPNGAMSEDKFVRMIEIESPSEKVRVASPGIANGDPAMASAP
jgi:hypothetical protein